jgi:hypothetical protein
MNHMYYTLESHVLYALRSGFLMSTTRAIGGA